MKKLFEFIHGANDGYLLGQSTKTGKPVKFDGNNRCTYIVGLSRMGKSTLMSNLILRDIERNDRCVIVLDPHSSLVESVLMRIKPDDAHRVTYFNPINQRKNVLGVNPLQLIEPTNMEEMELKANAFMQVIEHTWAINTDRTPTMQNTMETLIRTSMAAYPKFGTTFLHLLALTRPDKVGDYYRKAFAAEVTNPGLKQNWKEWENERRRKADMESSRQKIKHFTSSDMVYPILSQKTSSIRLDQIIRNNGVLLVGIRGLEQEFIKLIGSIILTQTLVSAWLRGEGNHPATNIYADEFYYFHPQSFEKIIDEGSKYKLFCTIATQSVSKLSGRSLRIRCKNNIAFRTSPDDAMVMRKYFVSDENNSPINPIHLQQLPQYHAMVTQEKGRRLSQAKIVTVENKASINRDIAIDIWKQSQRQGASINDIRAYQKEVLEPKFPEDTKTQEHSPTPLSKIHLDPAQQNGLPIIRQKVDSQSTKTNEFQGPTPLSRSPIKG